MEYRQALFRIKNLEKFGLKPGLSRIKKLLKLIGNPQKNLKFIHVAGTNGKGSVCFMLAEILKENGYRTGLYISPSINDFKERISINGEMISKSDVCSFLSYLESFYPEFSGDPLTEFEVITALAFKYFHEKKCDVVVLETGMGGRLDATNVIESALCSVITTVSFDHEKFLGKTIESIANEKLGIVKSGCDLVLGAVNDSTVFKLSENKCSSLGSRLTVADIDSVKDFKAVNIKNSEFIYKGKKVKTNFTGNHQRYNLSIVLSVVEVIKKHLKISEDKVISGLEKVKIPGRMEIVKDSPLVILDASHNPESVSALADFIEKNLKEKNLTALFGMFRDKDVDGCLEIIGKYFEKMVLVESENPRAMEVAELEKISEKYVKNIYPYKNFEEGLNFAFKNLGKDDVLIIFGSFSIIDLAKKFNYNY